MKKTTAALLIVLAIKSLGFAQTNVASTNEPTAAVATNAAPVEPVTTAINSTTESVAVTNTVPTAPEANPVTSAATTNAAPAASAVGEVATTNTVSEPTAAVIPLIQFSDVPITTAIENLARQAGINYLLDPKIGYGQPDANGQIKAEPTLSIRWENITAEHALVALLDNYSLQIVEDQKTGISRVTTKDPSAPPVLITRVVQLKYASVSNMVDAAQAALTDRRSKVMADSRTSQIIVVATEREQSDVDALVVQLDKPTKQVLIETRLIELSSNPTTTKGMDWSGTLAAQNIKFGNNSLPGTPPSHLPIYDQSGLNIIGYTDSPGTLGGVLNSGPGLLANTANGFNPSTFFLNADGVSAVLSFLNKDADAQVISTPRVVTLDNQTANISVVRAYPVFATTAGTQGSPGGSQVTYSNLGTILQVTPRISANDYIWLKVNPEVSSIFGTARKTVAGVINEADIYDYRKIDTQVLIPNSTTLVMGGLVKNNTQNNYTAVPVISQIPVLGLAFRNESKGVEKDNLLIFITPTIVQDTDFQASQTDFLKSSPNKRGHEMDVLNVMNRSRPKSNEDWSSPDRDPNSDDIDTFTESDQISTKKSGSK